MIYFLLPNYCIHTFTHIQFIPYQEEVEPIISHSLSKHLYEIKEKITLIQKEWSIYKKYTNPFEYIHTNPPNKKRSISMYRPLSRSFFKMIEILNLFSFFENDKKIKTFHLAEGPGGFIEAMTVKRNNPMDEYVGMTLLENPDDNTIPTWNKSQDFLRFHKNVTIENGIDNTGNILSLVNFIYCRGKYHSSMDFITADGGFDFSSDFNSQEIYISKLLFAQVCFALCMQAKGGSFVLKIFDCFMQHTVDILCILSCFYKKVYITKPQTSRYANSEKYIVCLDFIHVSDHDFYPFLVAAFKSMVDTESNGRFLNIAVNHYYLTRLEEYNMVFGQNQIENIQFTVSLIENKHNRQDKIENLVKIHTKKCINWCAKNNVLYSLV